MTEAHLLAPLREADPQGHGGDWWLWRRCVEGCPFTKCVRHDTLVLPQSMDDPLRDVLQLQRKMCPEPPLHVRDKLDLKVLSMNVLTLSTKQNRTAGGRGITARQEQLLRQCEEGGYMVVGVQETRSQMTGAHSTGQYHILAAPATPQGHSGVQLWIKKTWATAKTTIKIEQRYLHIEVLHARYIVATLNHPALQCVLITAHTPTGCALDEASRWWEEAIAHIPTVDCAGRCKCAPWWIPVQCNWLP